MIDVKDLRIGNIIFDETSGKNVKVTGGLFYSIDTLKNGIEIWN